MSARTRKSQALVGASLALVLERNGDSQSSRSYRFDEMRNN
jgi:hypothetical protein